MAPEAASIEWSFMYSNILGDLTNVDWRWYWLESYLCCLAEITWLSRYEYCPRYSVTIGNGNLININADYTKMPENACQMPLLSIDLFIYYFILFVKVFIGFVIILITRTPHK